MSKTVQQATDYLRYLESKTKLTKLEKTDLVSVRASIAQYIEVDYGSKEKRDEKDKEDSS
jgi:hypothetical protein